MKSKEYAKGLELFNKLHGAHMGSAIVELLKDVCPEYVDMNMEWAYAGITARPGLDIQTRVLLIIASCVSLGHPQQTRAYIETALGVGVSKEMIIETILQMLPLVGFPAVTNALLIAKDALAEKIDS